jgi:hypothetical protein
MFMNLVIVNINQVIKNTENQNHNKAKFIPNILLKTHN